MIQILGLRYYEKRKQMSDTFFDKGWRAKSVRELFGDIETFIEQIPEEERYNLFYTAAKCREEKGRKMIQQDIIPYDIDGIDLTQIEKYIPVVLGCIGNPDPNEVGVVFSGNGIQIIVETDQPIKDPKQFTEFRKYYKQICTNIDRALQLKGLPGNADPAIWSTGRLLRLPMTKNIKTPETGYANKNSTKDATLYRRMIVKQKNYDLAKIAGITLVKGSEKYKGHLYRGNPDTKYVLAECGFIQHCITNSENLSEDHWYKMLTLVGKLENGEELCHKYSENHPGYEPGQCQLKIDHAKDNIYKCTTIRESWDGCLKCPHWGKVEVAIHLEGPDHIRTKSTGFRNPKINAEGKITGFGSVNYDDLMKQFKQEHPFICNLSEVPYIWKDNYWQEVLNPELNAFCESKVKPSPKSNECFEFRHKIFRNNIRSQDWFDYTTFRKVNLQNGVLDITKEKPTLKAHDPKRGFQYILPYSYDPEATCPTFDQFMMDITLGRQELIDVLLEFAGYTFANEDCERAKALLLLGEGKNGKSTFVNVIKKLAGDDSFSTVSLNRFNNDQQMALLEGKLFNYTEETPDRAFIESSVFKNIVSGGEITVKKVYKQPYRFTSRAKLFMAMNDLPETTDTSRGMLRRMLVVPFDASFDGDKEDLGMKYKMFEELPGILNRVIEGYYRLKKQKNFTTSEIIRGEVESYREEIDNVYNFLKDQIVVLDDYDTNCYIYTSDLYSKYVEFCEDMGEKQKDILSAITFSKKFKKLLRDGNKRTAQKGHYRNRAYMGIKLKFEQSQDY